VQEAQDLQAVIARAGEEPNPLNVDAAFAYFVRPNGPADFKNIFRGPGADPVALGQAGNFAYFAIGPGFLPTWELDAAADIFGVLSVAFSSKKLSQLTSSGMDKSAASVRTDALAANGCQLASQYKKGTISYVPSIFCTNLSSVRCRLGRLYNCRPRH
jgi:hypothetical protein